MQHYWECVDLDIYGWEVFWLSYMKLIVAYVTIRNLHGKKWSTKGDLITSYDLFCCEVVIIHGPLARYVKLRVAHAPGMSETYSPPPQVSDPDMHHVTCVRHVPWCMPESLTCGFLWSRRQGKTLPALLAHAQPTILRIWQVAHYSLQSVMEVLPSSS